MDVHARDTAGAVSIDQTKRRLFESYATAYRKEACNLLRRTYPRLQKITIDFSNNFFRALSQNPDAAVIVRRITPNERIQLAKAHTEHLCQLLSPEVAAETHFQRAAEVGRAHEVVGIGLNVLFESYHQYQHELHSSLIEFDLDPRQREQLQLFIQQRLFLDLEAQIGVHYQIDLDTASFIRSLDDAIRTSKNLPDLLHSTMSAVTQLHGIVASLFHRPDARGYLRVEAAGGRQGAAYAEWMEHMEVPLIHTEGNRAEGQGPGGQAWRSGKVSVSDSYEFTPELEPWKIAWEELGFRSSAAIPLLDDSGRPFALLAFYSEWRGIFETTSSELILHHIQQTLSRAVTRFEQDKVIPIRTREKYCRLLEAKAVEMLFQPIINLKTGRLNGVEALARLRTSRGTLISPGMFLSALGKVDHLRLFQIALEQSEQAFSLWRNNGLTIPININLPPEGLIDDAYRDLLSESLHHGTLAPKDIRLELLEARDPVNLRKRNERLAEFHQMGFLIVQDDLGSGHSTLLRLGHIRFDSVKIDHGLVTGARQRPQRALEFIRYLTRLTQGFGVPITVEGIENRGLLEAAVVLGSDNGQGYNIGRPMAASRIPDWQKNFKMDVDPMRPMTPMGALAGFFLWDEQLHGLSRFPDLIPAFARRPVCVQHYIDSTVTTRPSGRPSIQALLARVADESRHGADNANYRKAKRLLVSELSQACRNEWPRRKNAPAEARS